MDSKLYSNLYSNLEDYKKGIWNILNHTREQLNKDEIYIGMSGLSDKMEFIDINDTMIQLFNIIPLITQKSARCSMFSYAGKHRMENLFTNKYISNGQFQLVMIALGFKYKYTKGDLNMSFFAKWRCNDAIGYTLQHPYPFFNS